MNISEQMAKIFQETPKQTVIRSFAVLSMEPTMPMMAFFPLNQRIKAVFHAYFSDRLLLFKSELIGIKIIYSYNIKQIQIFEPERDIDLVIYTFHIPIHQISESENLSLAYLKLVFEGLYEVFGKYYAISKSEIQPVYQQLVEEIAEKPELQKVFVEVD